MPAILIALTVGCPAGFVLVVFRVSRGLKRPARSLDPA
jgi:hypothetical protein